MFDIGFLELMVIAVVGIVVIGPERLPETIKTCALWIGRFRRMVRSAKAEIEQQIGADEIRQEIHNEDVMQRLKEIEEAKDNFEQKSKDILNQKEEEFEAVNPSHHSEESAPQDTENSIMNEQNKPL